MYLPLYTQWEEKEYICHFSVNEKRRCICHFTFSEKRKGVSATLHLMRRERVYPSKHDTLSHCWFNVGKPSSTLAQHWTNDGSMCRVCLVHPPYRQWEENVYEPLYIQKRKGVSATLHSMRRERVYQPLHTHWKGKHVSATLHSEEEGCIIQFTFN